MSFCIGISTRNNPEEENFARLINDNETRIIVGIGPAGSGKTITSISAALNALYNHQVRHILFCRDNLEVGRSLGYLPGDANRKISGYNYPLYDNLEVLFGNTSKYQNKNDSKSLRKSIKNNSHNVDIAQASSQIETIPIAFLRGRSLNNTILIVDEAQSLNFTTLQTICTRIGDYSKVVFLGSYNQIDDPIQRAKDKCDFQVVVEEIFESEEFSDIAKVVRFTKSMRSEFCVKIDEAFERVKKISLIL